MRRPSLITGLLLGACTALTPALADPVTVQSVLFDHDGSVLTAGAPQVDDAGNPVQNGDFLIFRIPEAADLPVGNGIDERTRGVFDFRSNADYGAFSALFSNPHGKITAATLQFVLSPGRWLPDDFRNDQFSLENGSFVGEPDVGNQIADNPFLDNSTVKLITINLLDYYSQEQLVNFISLGTGDFVNDGRIVFTYSDDAMISGAMLRLTGIIPEPGSLALALLSLALIPAARARRGAIG